VDIRPLAAGDMAAVAALCDRELVLDRAAATLPEVLMRSPRAAFVAISAGPRLAGVCFCSVAESDGEEPAGFLDLLVVDRPEQRQGVGRRLVAEMESYLTSRGCRNVSIAGHGPYFAWPGIDIHYTAAVCLAEDLGYRRGECEVNMDVDLQQAALDTAMDEERLRALGIEIRTALPADEDLLAESLAPTWRPDWITEIRAALRTESAGLEIALAGRQCTGFCAYGIRRLHEVGPVGVSPASRRHGVGSVLLRRCLAAQRRRGVDAAELVWAGPLSYFSRTLHATIGRAFWLYDKDLTERERQPDWRDRIGLI
jgi:mycothiol synthase